MRNVCAARTPKLPCPPQSYFNFLQCSATFSYMENRTGPNDELAQMLGRASQILRSYAKTRVCEYPFPNTSQTWSCPCISSSTRQQPTFACSLGQQDVSSAASNSAEKCISEQQLVCISLKLTGFAVCSQLVPVGIILHVLFDHQRAVWTVKLFERPQRGVNINPNNHKCQKMESSTQIRFKRHHSSKARVELKQYICISASSSWPATCSLSSPPDLIPKFVC